ncbi:MAG: Ig-like domain-containing protein, partial [Archangium sp.]
QALAVRQTGMAAGAAVDLPGLVQGEGGDLEHLGELTVAWSALDYGRPEVTWVDPAEDGQSVSQNAMVKVRVTNFRVGSGFSDDGYVKLTLMGGTNCEGREVPGTVTDSQGHGEVELPLPSGCSGTGVQLTATLVSPDALGGAPLSPPVESTRTLTIN